MHKVQKRCDSEVISFVLNYVKLLNLFYIRSKSALGYKPNGTYVFLRAVLKQIATIYHEVGKHGKARRIKYCTKLMKERIFTKYGACSSTSWMTGVRFPAGARDF
jgi:hypothetical protein